jgi:hypothetical protein
MTCVVVVEGARTMSVNEALAKRMSGQRAGNGGNAPEGAPGQPLLHAVGTDSPANSPGSGVTPCPSSAPEPSRAFAAPAPPDTSAELAGPRLSAAQLIDRIVTLNPTASSEFLAQFSPKSLGRYLAHLTAAQEPRGPASRWTRPGDSPAIVMAQR